MSRESNYVVKRVIINFRESKMGVSWMEIAFRLFRLGFGYG